MTTKPEVVIGKKQDNTTLFHHIICSRVCTFHKTVQYAILPFALKAKKQRLDPLHAEGEAQVLAELISYIINNNKEEDLKYEIDTTNMSAVLSNYFAMQQVVPVVNMFTNGPYVRFVSVNAPER